MNLTQAQYTRIYDLRDGDRSFFDDGSATHTVDTDLVAAGLATTYGTRVYGQSVSLTERGRELAANLQYREFVGPLPESAYTLHTGDLARDIDEPSKWELFPIDAQATRIREDQQRGIEAGERAALIMLDRRGTWSAFNRRDGSTTQSYETVGYHAGTRAWAAGVVMTGAPVLDVRRIYWSLSAYMRLNERNLDDVARFVATYAHK